MEEKEQIEHLADELDSLIERYAQEYDLSYASVIGVLEFKKHNLMVQAQKEKDSDW